MLDPQEWAIRVWLECPLFRNAQWSSSSCDDDELTFWHVSLLGLVGDESAGDGRVGGFGF